MGLSERLVAHYDEHSLLSHGDGEWRTPDAVDSRAGPSPAPFWSWASLGSPAMCSGLRTHGGLEIRKISHQSLMNLVGIGQNTDMMHALRFVTRAVSLFMMPFLDTLGF